MTTFPGSPKLLKGGIVLIDPESAAVQRVITLQYNPQSLSRSFKVQAVGGEGGDRSDALRLSGPAVETITIEAEIDAADQMEVADATTAEVGIHPQLAALETIIQPTSSQLSKNNGLAQAGTLEIIPMETALILFIWSKNRILPVRIESLSITEEAFDPNLNPLRAKVSLGMRVLTVDDLGFDHKGGSLFMNYLQQKEALAARMAGGDLSAFGIEAIP